MAAPSNDVVAQALANLTGPGSEFEMGQVTVRHGVSYPTAFLRGPQTLPEFYDVFFRQFADREFIIYEEKRYTYKQVDEMTKIVSSGLASQFGVQRGDRVAVSMRNLPEWCIGYIAATRMGAVVVPLNSLWKNDEYGYGLQDSGTKVLICDVDRFRMASAACAKLGVHVVVATQGSQEQPPGTTPFSALLESGTSAEFKDVVSVDPDDYASIMYTSGSTGNPKGVLQTHRNIMQQMMMGRAGDALAEEVGKLTGTKVQDTQPCLICPVPLFHVTGSHHVFLSSFPAGRKLVLMSKWDALKALQLIQKERATSWTGVPTMVQDMMEHPDFSKYDTSSLNTIGGGGGPTPKSQVSKSRDKFKSAAPAQGYGLTETNGGISFNRADEYLQRPDSIGKGYPIVQMQVRDVDTKQPLPSGESGELWIKTPLNMPGYHNRPDKTAEVLDADGWFASGDIGRIDEEGYAYIMDRAKDLIIRGGENISCAEVESAFMATGKALECAAFAIPDERLGEVVGLVVVPVQAHAGIAAKDLRDGVVGRIANFKMPEQEHIFVSQDRLPRGATEKILKKEIRETIVAKLKQDVRSKL